MADDFSKYQAMRNAGSAPEDVYRAALQDGLDNITRIRLIRTVYSLSPREAKDVWVRAEGLADSLDRHQQNIADNLPRLNQSKAPLPDTTETLHTPPTPHE